MLGGQSVKVIIPALNEAASIGKVLEDIPDEVDEIVVVDNGSSDDTAEVARAHGARVIREPRRGYGQACLAGMAAIGWCDIVVFVDADYSDYPEEMIHLVEPITRGQADFVIGSRVQGAQSAGCFTLPQRFGNALACCLMKLIWRHEFTDLGPFRAIRWSDLRSLKMQDRTYGWTVEMQIKALIKGLRVIEVAVGYRPRIGTSKISGTIRGVLGAGYKILGTIGRYALKRPHLKQCSRDRLIVFTRLPEPGRTKTRLIPAIGRLGAAQLHRRLAEGMVRTARKWAGENGVDLEVCYCGCDERSVRRWLGAGLSYSAQGKGDLGERMTEALGRAFDDGCHRVGLVGTDVPNADEGHLQQAMESLESHDVVLGATTDGGYWLIGLGREAALFDGIGWSTDRVLQETRERAAREQLSVAILPALDDVDRPEDLAALGPELRAEEAVISVIIPVVNEAGSVEAAIRSAQDEGVEVIVVDGGSTDETVARARALGVRVLSSECGRGRQMNCGAAAAQGDILLFLHGDTLLPEGYAGVVFGEMLSTQTVGGGFAWRTDVPGLIMKVAIGTVRMRTRWLREPWGDQAIFVRKSVFDRLGGFAELPIAEDWHFMQLLKRQGRIATLTAAVITSGRRWERVGILRAFLLNQVIAAGCRLSMPLNWLARLY